MSERDPHARRPLDPHLKVLENEAIHIFREVAAEADRPVMLHSLGKDSAVLLHLARKAFFPGRLPFPLLHIDTGWKFADMIAHREALAAAGDLEVRVHTNPRGRAEAITPFSHGSALYTDIMKTQALRQALDAGRYDAAFGGARRDEETARAKERIISVRSRDHRWDPRNQRPELWSIYNCQARQGESVRAFPLSNWTEIDIWRYIRAEAIPIVPLYFAAPRPVVMRDGMMILAEDERLPMQPGEVARIEWVRFRTLGCFPLTGALRSDAESLDDIIAELRVATGSEREGRAIDRDRTGSMERKKRDGYF